MWLGIEFWLRGGHRKALEASESGSDQADQLDPITQARSTRRPRLRRP